MNQLLQGVINIQSPLCHCYPLFSATDFTLYFIKMIEIQRHKIDILFLKISVYILLETSTSFDTCLISLSSKGWLLFSFARLYLSLHWILSFPICFSIEILPYVQVFLTCAVLIFFSIALSSACIKILKYFLQCFKNKNNNKSILKPSVTIF